MKADEIRSIVKNVSDFEKSIGPRVNALLKIDGERAKFDRVDWDECEKDCMYVMVSDRYDTWRCCIPIEHLSEDFDLDLFKKQVEESRKRTEERIKNEKEAKELAKELAEYKRLKEKFENKGGSNEQA